MSLRVSSMANVKQTREELLIDNAILRYNKEVSMMLDEKLLPLTKNQSRLEADFREITVRLDELEETIKPFTAFRRRLWHGLVFAILGASVIAIVYNEAIKYRG